jgi:arylsulfatase A-like enzyme
MRPPFYRSSPLRPSSSTLRSGVRSILGLASCLAALTLGCGGDRRETAVELADFALHQRHNVTTGLVSPADELTPWLATHGWRIDPEGDADNSSAASTMTVNRDRARLWFFSADGLTTGVEIRGGLFKAKRQRGRQVVHRLNGESDGSFVMLPGFGTYVVRFDPSRVRRGWNSFELRPRRAGGSPDSEIRVRGFRFLTSNSEAGPRDGAGRIETTNGHLRMPAGSLLDAVFEVPPGARFAAELAAERTRGDQAEIELSLDLTGPNGEETEIFRAQLEPAQRVRIDHDLGRWSGEAVRLRAHASGAPGAGAVSWGEARVTVPPAGTAANSTGTPTSGPTRIDVLERLIQPVAPPATGPLGRPDVVVILLDAARADAFSPWGGPYPTPVIEALSAEGTRFERALSPSSWTGQSMPAIFTGFHPDTVGVHKWGDELTDAIPTIAELFEGAGYQTTLWTQHPIYSRGTTLSRGFEETTYSRRRKRDRLPEITSLLSADRPSFTFFHLLPPHSPYSPPPPFARRYTSWFQGESPPQLGNLNRYPKRRDPDELTAIDRKYIRDRYQENVAFADALVGRIVDGLKAAGRYDNTLIAVISDHGEGFLEHDRFMHSRRLYWEFLHVPFVIKWPADVSGFRPVIQETVSLVDLAPTLAAGLGLPGGDRGFQGRDLLPGVFDEGERVERSVYAVTRGDGDPLRAPKPWVRLERDGWALLFDPLLDQLELYDLAADPTEQRNLAESRPTLALALLQELEMQRFFNRTLLGLATGDTGDLDPELAAELKALGYL